MAGAYSEYGINRYINETKRLFDVLESRLKDNEWLAGNKYTLADIASYSWVRAGPVFLELDLSTWPGIDKWVKRIQERPAVKKAISVSEGDRDPAQVAEWAKGMRDKIDAMKDTKRDS